MTTVSEIDEEPDRLARILMAAYRPDAPGVAVNRCGPPIFRFTNWVWRTLRYRPDPAADALPLPESSLIDEYLTLNPDELADESLASYRWILHRALDGLAESTFRKTYSHRSRSAPYSPEEISKFSRVARRQPSDARKRDMCAIVALAAGAGITGDGLRWVAPQDISVVELPDGSRATLVQVRGAKPRVTVLMGEFEPLLNEAIRLHGEAGRGEGEPLLGGNPDRRNVTGSALGRVATASGEGLDINVEMLRSTWLVALMCAAVPLKSILTAAGLKSARALTDLLPYCPNPDPAEVARAMRLAEQAPAGARRAPHPGQLSILDF